MAGVLGQSPIAHLAMSKLALDHPKRVLDLGLDAGLELFKLLTQRVDWAALVHSLALARHHGNVPVHIGGLILNLVTLLHDPVARVCKYDFFLAVQKGVCLRDVKAHFFHGSTVSDQTVIGLNFVDLPKA